MGYFPALKDDTHLADVFGKFNMGLESLTAFHDDVLRGESDLSIAERELIAAWVSASNDCQFCFNAHKVYALAFGIEETLFDAMIEDLDSAPVDARLKPLLAYCRKLTVAPARMVQADVDSVINAGWSEEALHTAILVTGIFNLMNRIIFAHGLPGNEALYAERTAEMLARPIEERKADNRKQVGSRPYSAFGATTDQKD